MFRTLRLTLAIVLMATFASATSAGGGDAWSIVRATGQVWIRADGAQTVALGDTRTVASGQTLATSANGRVLLQRGEETMVVGPSSVMRLPKELGRFFTTVLEAAGEIEFDVEKRNVKHFTVKTSYLAAVVKGTHFTVRAGADGDSVSVERGVVEVMARRTGQTVDLLPGQRADVSDDGLRVFGSADRADIGPGGGTETASAAANGETGSDGVSVAVGGSGGVNVGVGGGNGVNVSVGGSSGANVSVGGGNGVNVSVGGGNGVNVSVGGGNGIGAHVGGIGIGIGGP